MRRALRIPVLLAAWTCALPCFAQAQPEDVAAMYERGLSLREQHQDAEALAVFQRVFQLTHDARAEAQVALAEGQIGHLADAEAHLAEALSSHHDHWIRHNRRSLQPALERLREQLGALAVECDTAGAELWIGNERVATMPSPRPVRVVAGTVTFEVRAQGFVTETRSVQVPREPVRIERVVLRAVPPATPVVVAPPVPVVPEPLRSLPAFVATAPTVVVRPAAASRGGANGTTLRTLGWVGVGTAGVALGVGVVAMVLRESAAGRYNGEYCAGDGVPAESEPSEACRGDRSTVSSMQALGTAMFAVGGAVAVASVVALTVPRAGSERRSTAFVRCGPMAGVAGIDCIGSF